MMSTPWISTNLSNLRLPHNFTIPWVPMAVGVISYDLFKNAIEKFANSYGNDYPLLKNAGYCMFLAVVGTLKVIIWSKIAPGPILIITSLALFILNRTPTFGNQNQALILPIQGMRNLTWEARSNPPETTILNQAVLKRIQIVLNRKGEMNNVALVGPAGCGKTKMIETLAAMIAHHQVDRNSPLKGREIYSLSIRDLLAGTLYRGQLADRIQKIKEFSKTHPNAIWFLDEGHQLNGSWAGREDHLESPAQMLKDMLDRPGFCVVMGTTPKEFQIITRDPALKRRFEKIQMTPPTERQCFEMLKVQKKRYEESYKVTISDHVLAAAIVYANQVVQDTLPAAATVILSNICSSAQLRYSANQSGAIAHEDIVDYYHPNAGQQRTRLIDWLSTQANAVLAPVEAPADAQ